MRAVGIVLLAILVSVSAVTIEVCNQVSGVPQVADPVGCTPNLFDALVAASPGDVVHLNALQHVLYSSFFNTTQQQFLVVQTDGVSLEGKSPSTRTELLFDNDQVTPIVNGFRITASNFWVQHTIMRVNGSLPNLFTFFWFLPQSICNGTYCNVNDTVALYNNNIPPDMRQCIQGFTLQNNEIYFDNALYLIHAQGPIDLCGFRVNLNKLHNAQAQIVALVGDGAIWDCTDCASPCLVKRDIFQLLVPTCEDNDFRLDCWDVIPPFDVSSPLVWQPYWNCECNMFAPYWSIIPDDAPDDDDDTAQMVAFATVQQAMDYGIVDLYLGDDPVLVTDTTLINKPIRLIGHVPDDIDAMMQNSLFQMDQSPDSGPDPTRCNCTVSLLISSGVQPAFIVLNELLFSDRLSVRMEPLSAYALYRTEKELVPVEQAAVASLYTNYDSSDDDDDITRAYPAPAPQYRGAWPDSLIAEHSSWYQDIPGGDALNALLVLDLTQPSLIRRNFFVDIHSQVWVSAFYLSLVENSFYKAASTMLLGPGTHLTLDQEAFYTTVKYNAFSNASNAGILVKGGRTSDISCNAFADNVRGIWFPCANPAATVCAQCDVYVNQIFTCLNTALATLTCSQLILDDTHHPDQESTTFFLSFKQCAVTQGVSSVLTDEFILWIQDYLIELCLLSYTQNPADPLLWYLLNPMGEPLVNPQATLCVAITLNGFCHGNYGNGDDDEDDDQCLRAVGNNVIGNTFADPMADEAPNSPGSIWYNPVSTVTWDNTFDDNLFATFGYLVSLVGFYTPQPVTLPFGPLLLSTNDKYWVYYRMEFPAPNDPICFSLPDLQTTYWVSHNWHNISFPAEKDCNSTCAVQFNITETDWDNNKADGTDCLQSTLQGLTKHEAWVDLPTALSCVPDPLSWTTNNCFGNASDGDDRERYVRYVIGPGPPQQIAVLCDGSDMSHGDFPMGTLFYDTIQEAVDSASPFSTIQLDGTCLACHIHIDKPLTIKSADCEEPATVTAGGPCLYAFRYLDGSGKSVFQCVHFDRYCASSIEYDVLGDHVRHLSTALVVNPVDIPDNELLHFNETATKPHCHFFNLQTDTEGRCRYLVNGQLFGVPVMDEDELLDGDYRILDNCFSNTERGVFVGPAAGLTLIQGNGFGTGTCALPESKKRKKRSAVFDDSMTQGVWMSPTMVNYGCNIFEDQNPFIGQFAKRDAYDMTDTSDCRDLAEYLENGAAANSTLGRRWWVINNQFGQYLAAGVLVAGSHTQSSQLINVMQWIKITNNTFDRQRLFGVVLAHMSWRVFSNPLVVSGNRFYGAPGGHFRAMALSSNSAGVVVHRNFFGPLASAEMSGHHIAWIGNVHDNNTLDFTEDVFWASKYSPAGAGWEFGRYSEIYVLWNTLKDAAVAHESLRLASEIVSSAGSLLSHGKPFGFAKLVVQNNVFALEGGSLLYEASDDNPAPKDYFASPSFPQSFDDPGLDQTQISALFGATVTYAFTLGCPVGNCRIIAMDEAICTPTYSMDSDDLAYIVAMVTGRAAFDATTFGANAAALDTLFGPLLGADGMAVVASKKRGTPYSGAVSALAGITTACGDYLTFLRSGNKDNLGNAVWNALQEGEKYGPNGMPVVCGAGMYLKVDLLLGVCECAACTGLSDQYSCGNGEPPVLCDVGQKRDSNGDCGADSCYCSNSEVETGNTSPDDSSSGTTSTGTSTSTSEGTSSGTSSSTTTTVQPEEELIVGADSDESSSSPSMESSSDVWVPITIVAIVLGIAGCIGCCVFCCTAKVMGQLQQSANLNTSVTINQPPPTNGKRRQQRRDEEEPLLEDYDYHNE